MSQFIQYQPRVILSISEPPTGVYIPVDSILLLSKMEKDLKGNSANQNNSKRTL